MPARLLLLPGWRTKDTKATGVDSCLAPPGYELVSGASNISECAANTFKADWNRNPCVSCGTNLITDGTGAVSKDACLVPAGYGVISLEPLAAGRCVDNSYGINDTRTAGPGARCTPCAANLLTGENLPAPLTAAAPAEGYQSEQACVTQPGWGLPTSGQAELCPLGTYSVGGTRGPCQQCPGGYTTLETGSTASTACVIVAGWRMHPNLTAPEPCDKGTWSAGGDAITPAPTTCTPCGTGLTTQEDEATSADECSVCAAGYGGDDCERCPVDTYSFGGLTKGTACTPCDTNTVSSKGATDSNQCYADLVDPTRDYFTTSNDTVGWTSQAGVATLSDCEQACRTTSGCIQYRWKEATPSSCDLMLEAASGTSLALKVKGGVDYVNYKLDASLSFGKLIDTRTLDTLSACTAACTSNGDCEAVLFAGNSCRLVTSELDPDYVGKYRLVGAKLASYVA